jgi:hypothetical protein
MKVTLNSWSKLCGATELRRVYVNRAGTRDSLGYFERRAVETARGTGSYYDRHRIAKGDTTEVNDSPLRWVGPEGLGDTILTALNISAAQQQAAGKIGDDFGVFEALRDLTAQRWLNTLPVFGWTKKTLAAKAAAVAALVHEIPG